MEPEKKKLKGRVVNKMMIMAMGMMVLLLSASHSSACPEEDKGCKDCILDRLKCECPGCRPILRCLAGCLWNGVSQANCVRTCDARKGKKTRLSDCKKCMGACKCSCIH